MIGRERESRCADCVAIDDWNPFCKRLPRRLICHSNSLKRSPTENRSRLTKRRRERERETKMEFWVISKTERDIRWLRIDREWWTIKKTTLVFNVFNISIGTSIRRDKRYGYTYRTTHRERKKEDKRTRKSLSFSLNIFEPIVFYYEVLMRVCKRVQMISMWPSGLLLY